VQQETRDFPAAATSHQQVFRDFGQAIGQAEALNRLGELSSRTSASHQARERHTPLARHRPRHRRTPRGSTRAKGDRQRPHPTCRQGSGQRYNWRLMA
jgi:hypothetical protein